MSRGILESKMVRKLGAYAVQYGAVLVAFPLSMSVASAQYGDVGGLWAAIVVTGVVLVASKEVADKYVAGARRFPLFER
jgi:hypothetical protein